MSQKPKTNPYQKKYSRRELFQSLLGRGQRRDAAPSGQGKALDGDQLLASGEYAAAVKSYAVYLERFPDHVPTRCRMVLGLYKGGDFEGARAELEAMLARGTAVSFARLYLGLVLARQDRPEEALRTWKRYFNIDQPLIQRAINLLTGRQEIGDTPSAWEMVEEVESAIQAQQQADQQ